MGRRQAGHGDAIRRATHVVEPDLLEEGDRSGIATVLTTHPDLEIRPHRAAPVSPDLDQLAYPGLVE